jgi:predicted nucleotide-binding protein
MPYYHVYIDRDGEETEETDFSKEQLLKSIVKPYNKRKKFLCKGTIVYPTDVTTIRIIETEQSAANILPRIKAERGLMRLFGMTDFQILEETARDVTREFLQTKAKRQKKKALRKKKLVSPRKKVFIVHGRDNRPVQELKVMLTEFGLNPVVLHEQPSGSRTIVEKLEKYSDVGYAFVILTPDDRGCEAKSGSIPWPMSISSQITSKQLILLYLQTHKPRARQNVVLEFGFFMGLLGRDRVCCLHKGNVELPSDMHGIVYIPFQESITECREKIIKELKAIGYGIRQKGEAAKLRGVKWKDA